MANSKIFASANHVTRRAALSDTPRVRNAAGGAAFLAKDKAALVQMVTTGTFSDGFYTSASSQLNAMLALLERVDTAFVAKLAVYGRRQASMKDTPAFLLAWLSKHDATMFELAFPHVVDDGKMLKNFVQIVRSGVVGKRSLGSQAKRLVATWVQNANTKRLLAASIGNAPSLADVIRLAHPKPANDEQAAMFGWLLGREVNNEQLPQEVRHLMSFRRNPRGELPNVPFMLLTSMEMGTEAWTQICERASWQQLRMNLNTFDRHGVFANPEVLLRAAKRLADPKAIEDSKVLPFQLLAAALNLQFQSSDYIFDKGAMSSAFEKAMGRSMSSRGHGPLNSEAVIRQALFDAMEASCGNIPEWEGKRVGVLMDVSGSMTSVPVTGIRGNTSSKVMSAHAAGLFAAVIARRNPEVYLAQFHTSASKLTLPKRGSLKEIYESLKFPGGGTDCASGILHLLENRVKLDYIFMLSDNESHAQWGRSYYGWSSGKRCSIDEAWLEYKKFHPAAKLVCVDFAPNSTVQLPDMHDVLNVGGFSDDVFRVADRFLNGTDKDAAKGKLSLVADIEAIVLEELALAA